MVVVVEEDIVKVYMLTCATTDLGLVNRQSSTVSTEGFRNVSYTHTHTLRDTDHVVCTYVHP